MRILHTADWHLGHTLHELPREAEHRQFLSWLLDLLGEHRVDALLLAGDVFETANPSATALEIWYGFLAEARKRYPQLDIVVVGGNHDSAARLDAPRPILQALNVFMVGGLPRKVDRSLDMERLLAPLHNAQGEIAAWVAAVPYLRVADLPRSPSTKQDPSEEREDVLIAGVRQVYAEALTAARQRCEKRQALLATGHCYMIDTMLSERSERRILGGNQHALPVDIFPEDVAYVALGHLHLPQDVGCKHVRYSGSPIPLSLGERDYPHQVLLVDFAGEQLASVKPCLIPRTVDMLRIPKQEALPLVELLPLLRELPSGGDEEDQEGWPFLEVHVSLPAPEPTLRTEIENALVGRRARLVRIHPTYTGSGEALGDEVQAQRLDELQVEEVFLKCWHTKYEEKPSAEILEAFHELAEQVQRGEA